MKRVQVANVRWSSLNLIWYFNSLLYNYQKSTKPQQKYNKFQTKWNALYSVDWRLLQTSYILDILHIHWRPSESYLKQGRWEGKCLYTLTFMHLQCTNVLFYWQSLSQTKAWISYWPPYYISIGTYRKTSNISRTLEAVKLLITQM